MHIDIYIYLYIYIYRTPEDVFSLGFRQSVGPNLQGYSNPEPRHPKP